MTAHRDALVARVTAVLERVGQRNAEEVAACIIDDVVLAPQPVSTNFRVQPAHGGSYTATNDEVASMTFVSPDFAERGYPLEVLGNLLETLLELLEREAEKRNRVVDPTLFIAVQCQAHTTAKRGLL